MPTPFRDVCALKTFVIYKTSRLGGDKICWGIIGESPPVVVINDALGLTVPLNHVTLPWLLECVEFQYMFYSFLRHFELMAYPHFGPPWYWAGRNLDAPFIQSGAEKWILYRKSTGSSNKDWGVTYSLRLAGGWGEVRSDPNDARTSSLPDEITHYISYKSFECAYTPKGGGTWFFEQREVTQVS